MDQSPMSGTRFLIRTFRLVALILVAVNLSVLTCSAAADDPEVGSLNKQEKLECFRDQGFGLFIHWSVDSQLGVVISHSLVGASPEYTDRFFNELPKPSTRMSFTHWIGLGWRTWRAFAMSCLPPSTIPASLCSTRQPLP